MAILFSLSLPLSLSFSLSFSVKFTCSQAERTREGGGGLQRRRSRIQFHKPKELRDGEYHKSICLYVAEDRFEAFFGWFILIKKKKTETNT